MDLVDEEDRVRLLLEPLQHLLDTLLEVAAISRPREQRAEIERVHLRVAQRFGHLAFVDAQRQAFSQCGLADAWLADEQRIVLPPAAEHLNHPLELERAADERIDLPGRRACDEIRGVRVERIGGGRT